MGKVGDIIFFVVLIIVLLIAFPDTVKGILSNKLYTIFAFVGAGLVIFFIWLRTQNR